jgi:hypothetical protein
MGRSREARIQRIIIFMALINVRPLFVRKGWVHYAKTFRPLPEP